MKNNKGFTLIELLAVIAILGIVITITGISVSGVLKKSKNDVSDIEMKNIERAAELYVTKNRKQCKNGCKIDIQTLISEGYLDIDSDTVGTINVTKNGNKYNYSSKINVFDFAYTGSVQEVTLPKGTYKLEVWGAQGGYNTNSYAAGKGGYSTGIYTISNSTALYIYVGGKGSVYKTIGGIAVGGWNGGGAAYASNWGRGSGGGASDISLVGGNCTLSNNRYIRTDESYNGRIIVAGGGGGATGLTDGMTTESEGSAGYGGGINSGSGAKVKGTSQGYGTGASSSSYGTNTSYSSGNASFGYGGSGSSSFSAAGGGGGWYGGAAGSGAGGGSGYVSSSLTNAQTIAGNQEFLSPTGESETGHSGDGHVRITKQ